MKRSIFQFIFRIAAIALFLKAAVVQAEAFNCMSSSSSKVIELIMEDPVHPACPPAACQDGYSCQPDPVEPPPGECPDFLKEYVNLEEQSLPEDRVYPLGRKMMLTAWLATSASDLQEMADHGFTMQGPVWDTRDLAHINTAKAKGLRVVHKVNDGAGSVYKLLPKLDGGTEESKLWREVESRITRIVNNPDWNETVDIWLQGTEEISTRNSGNVQKLNAYIRKFKETIERLDPQKRPLWMSDVTGSGSYQMIVTHPWLDMVGPQMYVERIGGAGKSRHNAVVQRYVKQIVDTRDRMDRDHPVLRPRMATASFGAFYEPIPGRDNPAFINKHTEHDWYLAFNTGLQGAQIYSWHNYNTRPEHSDAETWNWYKNAYYKHVKLFTDYDLDNVYLWGDRREDLSIKILSGPERISWTQGLSSHDYPSVSMANIQYGNHRYLMLTNSAERAVQVEISGFPQNCVRTLDIREGKYWDNSGEIKPTLQPLDVRLYRFDPI